MRPRPALIAFIAALAVVLLGGLLFIASFDVDRYKTQLVDGVAARTGRTLTIDGPLSLTLLPRLGLSIGRAQLSGPGGTGEFASVEAAHVRIALWPLLSRRLVIERVTLDRLQVDAVRGHDGRTNFDDLLAARPAAAQGTGGGPAETSPMAAAVTVAGIELHQATLRWRDEPESLQWQMAGVELDIDRLASNQPGSLRMSGRLNAADGRLDLKVKAASHYTIDLPTAAIRLSKLDVEARGKAPSAPALDARLAGAMLVVDPQGRRFELSGVSLLLRSGDGVSASVDAPSLGLAPSEARGQPINARLTIERPGQRSDTRLAIAAPRLDNGRIVFSDIVADIDLNHDAMRGKGRIVGSMSLDASLQRIQWPRWSGTVELTGPALPANGTRLALHADAIIDRARQLGELSLHGSLDDAPLQLRVHTSRWSPLAIRYELQAGRIDLDRYGISRDPTAARNAPATQSPSASSAPRGVATPSPAASPIPRASTTPSPVASPTPRASVTPSPGASPSATAVSAAPSAPIGSATAIRWVAGLETQGTLRIETLKTAGIEIGDFAALVRTGGARIELPEFSAALYHGRLAGNAVITAQGRHGLQLRLDSIDAGQALRTLSRHDLLEGRGNFELRVTGEGFDAAAITSSLDGHARLALRDGALKGIDLPQLLRQIRTLIGSKTVIDQPAESRQRTDFASLDAGFELRNGIAHNDDLDIRSPLLRIGGAGRIDLPRGTLDYLAKVSLVGSLTGQGGAELARLRGLTVPVQLSGPFDKLSYRVDVAGLAGGALKQELTRRLLEKAGGKTPQGDDVPASPERDGKRRATELLRGLLGR